MVGGAFGTGEIVRVGGAELHHMRDVMRLGAGAEVVLIAPGGTHYSGRITGYAPDYATIEIESFASASADPAAIILAPAIIKGPRMDFLIEKAVELGAAAIWPVVCTRAVVRDPGAERLARWRRLVVAAAKQSLAPRTADLCAPRTVAELAAALPPATLALVCAEGGAALGAAIRRARPRAILIACGPEGDFAPDERATLDAAGFAAVGLGPRRLRSETAALAAIAIACGALDETDREA
ncbi:MAG: 16S rRNA (uracil(1498)-N(3))-methyltransferase [Candidatus Binataceae bacterium]|nr:16S rRNA (uracil(1498)-N(3))-methyltransferase [Candidatus Binataceae bacterium]